MAQRIKHLYLFGAYCLDPTERLLLREGTAVSLPPKAFDILALLVANGGRLLPKDEMMRVIWPDAFVEDANLAQHISFLRKTLGDDSESRRYIETIPKAGYRFIAEVQTMVEEVATAPVGQDGLGRGIGQPPSVPPGEPEVESGEPYVARPVVTRHPKTYQWTLLAAGFLLGLGSAAVVIVAAARRPPPPQYTPLATESHLSLFPAWAPDGRSIAYSAEIRGTLQIVIRSLGASAPTQLTAGAADCLVPLWSPDGRRIYYTATEGGEYEIRSCAVAGGAPELVMRDARLGTISPDGKTLLFLRRGREEDSAEVWVSSPPGAAPSKLERLPFSGRQYLARSYLRFSPDGRRLGAWFLLWDGRPEFWALPFPQGPPRLLPDLPPFAAGPASFSWMPDNRRLIYSAPLDADSGPRLWTVDTATGDARPISAGASREQSPSVSTDGKRVAFASVDGGYDSVRVSLNGSGMEDVLATSRNELEPVWVPGGGRLALVTDHNGSREIWLTNPSGAWDRPLVTGREFGEDRTIDLGGISFSPDGQRIAYHRKGVNGQRIWISTLAGDPPSRLWDDKRSSLEQGPAWSPDGNWVVFVSRRAGRSSLLKCRIGDAGEPAVLAGDVGNAEARWAPRGDSIAFGGNGLTLISPDGKDVRVLSRKRWLLFGWSRDGDLIYGVRRAENRRLILASVDPREGQERLIADLGPYPAAAVYAEHLGLAPFRGFSLAPDGRGFLTSVFRARSAIWMLEDFEDTPGILRGLYAKLRGLQ